MQMDYPLNMYEEKFTYRAEKIENHRAGSQKSKEQLFGSSDSSDFLLFTAKKEYSNLAGIPNKFTNYEVT